MITSILADGTWRVSVIAIGLLYAAYRGVLVPDRPAHSVDFAALSSIFVIGGAALVTGAADQVLIF